MLKFHKKEEANAFSLGIREKIKIITPTFKKAFFIAFFLHFFGLVLFHVQPFRIKQTESQFPPVEVNIEMGSGAVFAELEKKHQHPAYRLSPIFDEPIIETEWQAPIDKKIAYPKLSHFALDPFPKVIVAADEIQPPLKTFEVIVSGHLTDRKLLAPNPKIKTPPYERHSYLFEVRVDNQSGEILWAKLIHEGENNSASAIAMKTLEKLSFEPLDRGFITPGYIEIDVVL